MTTSTQTPTELPFNVARYIVMVKTYRNGCDTPLRVIQETCEYCMENGKPNGYFDQDGCCQICGRKPEYFDDTVIDTNRKL